MEKAFEKFKEKILLEYPTILIKGIFEGDFFNIYYYLENFNIKDMSFHEILGRCLNESFSEEELQNIGTEYLLEEEVEKYFPEMFDISFMTDLLMGFNKDLYISERKSFNEIVESLSFDLNCDFDDYYSYNTPIQMAA